jgi:hypothetical protein
MSKDLDEAALVKEKAREIGLKTYLETRDQKDHELSKKLSVIAPWNKAANDCVLSGINVSLNNMNIVRDYHSAVLAYESVNIEKAREISGGRGWETWQESIHQQQLKDSQKACDKCYKAVINSPTTSDLIQDQLPKIHEEATKQLTKTDKLIHKSKAPSESEYKQYIADLSLHRDSLNTISQLCDTGTGRNDKIQKKITEQMHQIDASIKDTNLKLGPAAVVLENPKASQNTAKQHVETRSR